MPRPNSTIYIPVQHSAFAYKGDSRFAQALEPGACTDDKILVKAIRDGAEIFRDYKACEEYCLSEMFPIGAEGMRSRAPGTFLDLELDGRKIYKPKVLRA